MFGAKIMEHDERYIYASEWLHVLRLLWTAEEEFDLRASISEFSGDFINRNQSSSPFQQL
jgi:alkanesulfonate monooxygenase SsuD/methylene tetrahydromethanopterin reductase-like flavin-dependent oxidoreductase (luciferase family)